MPHISGQSLHMEKRIHMAPDQDDRGIINKKASNIIQLIVRNILYYDRSVDPTMLRADNEILWVQSKPARYTKEKSIMLLYYAAIYPNAITHYTVTDMVVHVELDAPYLAMPESRICYGGRFYQSNLPSPSPIRLNHKRNRPIHTAC